MNGHGKVMANNAKKWIWNLLKENSMHQWREFIRKQFEIRSATKLPQEELLVEYWNIITKVKENEIKKKFKLEVSETVERFRRTKVDVRNTIQKKRINTLKNNEVIVCKADEGNCTVLIVERHIRKEMNLLETSFDEEVTFDYTNKF